MLNSRATSTVMRQGPSRTLKPYQAVWGAGGRVEHIERRVGLSPGHCLVLFVQLTSDI